MKKLFWQIVCLVGLGLVVGTAGGLELGYITLGRAMLQGCAGLVLMFFGADLGGLFYE